MAFDATRQRRRAVLRSLAVGAAFSSLVPFRRVARAIDTREAAVPRTGVVRVGYQKWGLLFFLKAKRALDEALARQDVRVEWAEFPAGPQLVEAMSAGRLDLGVVGEGPPIFGQAAGAPLVYVAAEPPAPAAEAIVVAKDSPIRTVADLKGRIVVLNKGSNVHYFLIRALEEAGVAYGDVKISFVPPAGARAAFESGKADAWAIWDPFLASVQSASGARVVRDAVGLAANPGYYLGTRRFADANPQLVRLFVDVVHEGGLYVNQHPEEVVAVLAPQLGIEKSALSLALDRTRFGAGPLTPDLLSSQQQIADVYFRLKLIPRRIRVADALWSPRSAPPRAARG